MIKNQVFSFLLFGMLGVFGIAATSTPAANASPWSLAYLFGWMTNNNIGPLLFMDDVHFEYGTMNSVELSYELAPTNPIRHFFSPVSSTMDFANDITVRNDPNGIIYEYDTYLMLRWEHFPWDKYLVNTFAFGDGLSYVTAPPEREVKDSSIHDPKRLLNFLTLEATFALPQDPNVEVVLRIHHRCGAWGLFGAGNLSSNALELGVRYHF